MSYIRGHFLANGAALDRRQIEELFLSAGKKLTEIDKYALGSNILDRNDFEDWTWEEYFSSSEVDVNYKNPIHPHQMPGTDIVVLNDDTYFEAEVTWSLKARVTTERSPLITAWPVLNGESLWAGQDLKQTGPTKYYLGAVPGTVPDPINDASNAGFWGVTAGTEWDQVTLGGTCRYRGKGGRSYAGVFMASIGAWEVISASMTVRILAR